ncbi:MAG TPA: IS110 family transposase [Phycisphaerae bacterium]|nr:IS110 family transposase [Phycisphaerae bacterium]
MIILALDLGKNKTVGCIFDTADNKFRYKKIKTVAFALINLVEEAKPERVIFEIGTSAGWVYDIVHGQGIGDIQVANPNHEGWRWRNVKSKTDRLDALKLAKLSMVDQLPLIHMPSAKVREHRALIHYRGQLVSRRTRIKNTIRSLLHRIGLEMPAGKNGWSKKAVAELAEISCPTEECDIAQLWRCELHEELIGLEAAEQSLARVEKRLDAIGESDERIQRLRTMPGVGPRLSELVVAVLDDPHRFQNGGKASSYVGLTPRQYQSGQMDRKCHISKQGHRQLRQMLVEVSWIALKYNPQLRAFYHRVCRGQKSRRKIAIVAVARKLLVYCWAMLRDGTNWTPVVTDMQQAS